MNCINCHKKIADGARFCKYCGSEIKYKETLDVEISGNGNPVVTEYQAFPTPTKANSKNYYLKNALLMACTSIILAYFLAAVGPKPLRGFMAYLGVWAVIAVSFSTPTIVLTGIRSIFKRNNWLKFAVKTAWVCIAILALLVYKIS